MEYGFEPVGEPNGRAILSLLVPSQQSVEIASRLPLTQPTASKHLRVLREDGFRESRVDAQSRLYRLEAGPLGEPVAWLAGFHRFWSDYVDALERHLDRIHPSRPAGATPAKKKAKRNRRGANRGNKKGRTK